MSNTKTTLKHLKPFLDMDREKSENREKIRELNRRNREIDVQAIEFALEKGMDFLVKFDWRKLRTIQHRENMENLKKAEERIADDDY